MFFRFDFGNKVVTGWFRTQDVREIAGTPSLHFSTGTAVVDGVDGVLPVVDVV